jgi:hypothetical protein
VHPAKPAQCAGFAGQDGWRMRRRKVAENGVQQNLQQAATTFGLPATRGVFLRALVAVVATTTFTRKNARKSLVVASCNTLGVEKLQQAATTLQQESVTFCPPRVCNCRVFLW